MEERSKKYWLKYLEAAERRLEVADRTGDHPVHKKEIFLESAAFAAELVGRYLSLRYEVREEAEMWNSGKSKHNGHNLGWLWNPLRDRVVDSGYLSAVEYNRLKKFFRMCHPSGVNKFRYMDGQLRWAADRPAAEFVKAASNIIPLLRRVIEREKELVLDMPGRL